MADRTHLSRLWTLPGLLPAPLCRYFLHSWCATFDLFIAWFWLILKTLSDRDWMWNFVFFSTLFLLNIFVFWRFGTCRLVYLIVNVFFPLNLVYFIITFISGAQEPADMMETVILKCFSDSPSGHNVRFYSLKNFSLTCVSFWPIDQFWFSLFWFWFISWNVGISWPNTEDNR